MKRFLILMTLILSTVTCWGQSLVWFDGTNLVTYGASITNTIGGDFVSLGITNNGTLIVETADTNVAIRAIGRLWASYGDLWLNDGIAWGNPENNSKFWEFQFNAFDNQLDLVGHAPSGTNSIMNVRTDQYGSPYSRLLAPNDVIWESEGEATNGNQIVNWNCLTNHIASGIDYPVVFGDDVTTTGENTFSMPTDNKWNTFDLAAAEIRIGDVNTTVGVGTDAIYWWYSSAPPGSELGWIMQGSLMSFGNRTNYIMSFNTPSLRDDGGIWQSEGLATSGLQIVNFTSMTNYCFGLSVTNTWISGPSDSVTNVQVYINGQLRSWTTNGVALP